MKINIFRDDLTDVSAKKVALVNSGQEHMAWLMYALFCHQERVLIFSVAVLAETPFRPPRKLFIFIVKKHIYRIKVSKKIVYLLLKTEALFILR